MEWIAENWSQLALAFGALHTLVSVVVGLTPTPEDDKVWARILRVISFIRSDDEPGSVKLPGGSQ